MLVLGLGGCLWKLDCEGGCACEPQRPLPFPEFLHLSYFVLLCHHLLWVLVDPALHHVDTHNIYSKTLRCLIRHFRSFDHLMITFNRRIAPACVSKVAEAMVGGGNMLDVALTYTLRSMGACY
jgi:hypothetical protein